MLVKVCGITNVKDALMVVDQGADAVGVIIDVPVETPRKISIGKAAEIRRALRNISHTFITVMMPEKVDEVLNVVKRIGPDGVQLHGTESPEFLEELRESIEGYIIKTVHASSNLDMDYVKAVAEHADMMLVDTLKDGKVGGTGSGHDRSIDLRIKELTGKPLIASGGINSDNVAQVIGKVAPYAVDVSSGVESSQGIKSKKKVAEFMRIIDGTR
ncbi:phosphoribosylanthranilate isomerase [Candidatus Altiarchaeota archaeon]